MAAGTADRGRAQQQPSTAFQLELRVYHEDVDTQGVVYYANYLKFMERARTEWLRGLGVEQDQLAAEAGLFFAVSRLSIDYKLPAIFNDLLRVSVRMTRLGRASMELEQEIHRGDEGCLCRAAIRIACVDTANYRPRPIPGFLSKEIANT